MSSSRQRFLTMPLNNHLSIQCLQILFSLMCKLLMCWLQQCCVTGLLIPESEEVEYVRSHVTATAGSSVTFDCGPIMPHTFIWGFTKPLTDNIVALAYNYGHGVKLQVQSNNVGNIQVPVSTSKLVIENLQKSAVGTYTCQAMYDTDDGPKVIFYYTRLDVEETEDWHMRHQIQTH